MWMLHGFDTGYILVIYYLSGEFCGLNLFVFNIYPHSTAKELGVGKINLLFSFYYLVNQVG